MPHSPSGCPSRSSPGSSIPTWKAWVLAARPKTLAAAALPVLLATCCSLRSVTPAWLDVVIPLVFALSLQVGTNFHNDLCDGIKGTDGSGRLGPARAVASGWISPVAMRRGVWAAMLLGLVVAMGLTLQHIWIAPLAGACVLAALGYTAGEVPLSYRGWGEALCLLFFGPVAFLGTTLIQGGALDSVAVALSLACGAYATALLVINNVRDLPSDLRSGKRTLAVRFGERFGRVEVVAALMLPLLLGLAVGCWASLAALPASLPIFRRATRLHGQQWNQALGLAALSYLLFAVAIAVQLLRRAL
jgi:1,4-dihydroxy-2-naphthoate octaprenyltransferase